MKFFSAHYHQSFGWGAYTTHEYAVVANTRDEALGLVLTAEPDSQAAGWTICELDGETPAAHHLTTGGT